MLSPDNAHEAVYIQLPPNGPLPEWTHRKPFNAVVVATCGVSYEWQTQVSDWLVRSGCLYMMAWGINCSVWDDAVDDAARKFYDPGEIPDEGFVLTTWHTHATLEEVFWNAQFEGTWTYGDEALDLTLILDIGHEERGVDLLALFAKSRDWPDRVP